MSESPKSLANLPSSVRLVGVAAGNDDSEDALAHVDITSSLAAARAYYHGAHLARWHPAHIADPVLWMSRHSLFRHDKPIRGGIPICFPWFGPHPTDPKLPAHGFARVSEWTLTDAHESREGTVALTFVLSPRDSPPMPWPPFELTCQMVIGAELRLRMTVENTGSEPFTFEEALHTYFTVADIERISITGLESAGYLDKTQNFAKRTQAEEPIRFSGETDRTYPGTTAACTIHDPGLGRQIVIDKTGSHSTVVWNPWIDKARAMPDFGDEEWRRMVCVETANVGDDAIRLEPGASHVITVAISVRAL